MQGALQYKLNAAHALQLSVARKTRFATTKDRYSYRLGTAIPNPDLSAEYAVNYDLSYNGIINDRLHVQGAAFYSRINNTIYMVSNVFLDPVRNVWQSQLQNVGEASYKGAEFSVQYDVMAELNAGLPT